jgi:hypothetical protein
MNEFPKMLAEQQKQMSAQFQVPIPYLVGKAVDRLKEIIGQIGE